MNPRPDVRSLTAGMAWGCAAYLVTMPAVAWGLRHYMTPGVAEDVRVWFALAAAVFLTLGAASVLSLATGYGRGDASRAAILRRAESGELPQQDGLAVVSGTVRPLGAPLESPLTGTACVAYWYRMYYKVRGGTNRERRREVPVYWGYACRPFRLDSPTRAVRVMAVPKLTHEAEVVSGDLGVQRARHHAATSRFEIASGLLGAVGTAVTTVQEMFTDDDGDVRRDWKAAAEPRDPSTLILEEAVLPVGVTASVAGSWSADRGCIIASSDAPGGLGVTATLGSPSDLAGVQGAVPPSTTSYVVTSALLIAIGAAIVWAAGRFFPAT